METKIYAFIHGTDVSNVASSMYHMNVNNTLAQKMNRK